MKWLYRFEHKHPRFGIQNLMLYIVAVMGFVYLFDRITLGPAPLSSLLYFNRDLILSGQVWRLVTFVFLPPQSTMLFILFALYFYYLIGMSLEAIWGKCIFTLYYLIGVLGTIAAGFIAGSATNMYLNLSLFFAFAILNPDFQVLVFFILPVKIKYLALFSAFFLLVNFVIGTWADRASIIASLLNLFLFFGGQMTNMIKREIGFYKTRQNFRRQTGSQHNRRN